MLKDLSENDRGPKLRDFFVRHAPSKVAFLSIALALISIPNTGLAQALPAITSPVMPLATPAQAPTMPQTAPQPIPASGQPGAPLGKLADSAEETRLYASRFALMASGGTGGDATALYDVREAVPGAARPKRFALATPAQRTISDAALAAANTYAGANNSNALLVWRAGK